MAGRFGAVGLVSNACLSSAMVRVGQGGFEDLFEENAQDLAPDFRFHLVVGRLERMDESP